jgi:hypothetical protein
MNYQINRTLARRCLRVGVFDPGVGSLRLKREKKRTYLRDRPPTTWVLHNTNKARATRTRSAHCHCRNRRADDDNAPMQTAAGKVALMKANGVRERTAGVCRRGELA